MVIFEVEHMIAALLTKSENREVEGSGLPNLLGSASTTGIESQEWYTVRQGWSEGEV
jgi:hypothetical protein